MVGDGGFNWRAADGLLSLHGAATKQHTKATTRNLSFSGPFYLSKGGDTETKKRNAKMCRSKRLWVPLFHEAAQWTDCVSLAALDDCLYHFGAVQTDPPPHL